MWVKVLLLHLLMLDCRICFMGNDCDTFYVQYESNTRFVRWSDGSLQLFIGNEVLDISVQDAQHDQAHLFLRHGKVNLCLVMSDSELHLFVLSLGNFGQESFIVRSCFGMNCPCRTIESSTHDHACLYTCSTDTSPEAKCRCLTCVGSGHVSDT